MMSVTRTAPPRRVKCTTTSTASDTKLFNADIGSDAPASVSWHMKRSRVSVWLAEPAWMIVKPYTPEEG